jgi:hypothetical protein
VPLTVRLPEWVSTPESTIKVALSATATTASLPVEMRDAVCTSTESAVSVPDDRAEPAEAAARRNGLSVCVYAGRL